MNKKLAFFTILAITHLAFAFSANAQLPFCGGPGNTSVSAKYVPALGAPPTSFIGYNTTNKPVILSATKGLGSKPLVGSGAEVFSCPNPPNTQALDCGDPTGVDWINTAPVTQPPYCMCKSYVNIQASMTGVSPLPTGSVRYAAIGFHNPPNFGVVPNIPGYNRTQTDVLELENFPFGVNNDKWVSFTTAGEFADGFFGLVLADSTPTNPGEVVMEILTRYDPGATASAFSGDALFYAYNISPPPVGNPYNCAIWVSQRIEIQFRQ